MAHAEAMDAGEVFEKLRVGHLMTPEGMTHTVRASDTLVRVAEELAASGRTAVVVAESDDKVLGLVTQNDIMRAYFEGVSPKKLVGVWLANGPARASRTFLERLTVRPSDPLSTVAQQMVSNAIAGDCACHHAVIQCKDGKVYGVISSHDLVRALASPEMWQKHPMIPDMFAPPDAVEAVESMSIVDVMKHRDRVFTSAPSGTIREVLKILLVTQQNSTLIIDDTGIHGLITPRDMVEAFADGVDGSVVVADWLIHQTVPVADRIVESDVHLFDAANIMTEQKVDHLVVVLRGTMEAVGVLSSLDILLRTKARTSVLRSRPLWAGPTVGEVLANHASLTKVHPASTTLGEAAAALLTSGSTSAIMQVDGVKPSFRLLTENDLVRAYIDGWHRTTNFQSWREAAELHSPVVPLHLMVPPTMPLTDAASLMLSAAEPGRTCHHLVVKALTGGWLGVFSSLDVARVLQGLCSNLDKAKTLADKLTVDMVMKPAITVPTCRPGDTLRDALSTLDVFCQNAALVTDDAKYCGLLTSRCALQVFSAGTSQETRVRSWLSATADHSREILLGTPLLDAAAFMAAHALHHLVVVPSIGADPVGVLSSLDLVRGIASINYSCPFASLAWLHTWRKLSPVSPKAHHAIETKPAQKRSHSEEKHKEGSHQLPPFCKPRVVALKGA